MIHRIQQWLDDQQPNMAVYEVVPHDSEVEYDVAHGPLFTEVILTAVAANGQSMPVMNKRVPIEAETIQEAFLQLDAIQKAETPKMIAEFEAAQRKAALQNSVKGGNILNNRMKLRP